MQRVANEKAWSTNEFGVFDGQPNILAWEIPWTEKPGGLQALGSQNSLTRLSD